MLRAIVNGKIAACGKLLLNHALVFNHKIQAICPVEDLHTPSVEIIDARDLLVSPGLIDTHVHGIAGADTMDCDLDRLLSMSSALAAHGVTSFLPTTMTMPLPQIEQSLVTIRAAMKRTDITGARVLGAHLEGPFINRDFSGAHKVDYMIPPDLEGVLCYRDVVRIVTFAPELDVGNAFARGLLDAGIVPSIGHTGADCETTESALEAGVFHVTHLFNAMPRFHHRHPGPLGAILGCSVMCELIADNVHVHPDVYPLLLRTIGLEHIVLVSDSMRAASLGDGVYELGGQTVTVHDGSARLENGALAGSVLTLNQAILKFQQSTGLTMPSALYPGTLSPANLLGLRNRKGSLSPGLDADIVLFDEEMNARLTIVEGRIVHERD